MQTPPSSIDWRSVCLEAHIFRQAARLYKQYNYSMPADLVYRSIVCQREEESTFIYIYLFLLSLQKKSSVAGGACMSNPHANGVALDQPALDEIKSLFATYGELGG